MLNFVRSIFKIKPPTPYQICIKTISRMGYKQDIDGSYIKENVSGLTKVWFFNTGVKIKVVGKGYDKADFLPDPLPVAVKLTAFIKSFEL